MAGSDAYRQRREDVAAAVWRVLDQAGFAGLSMRAVARELDATTGIVTHYFPSKRELTSFALELLAERSGARERPATTRGPADLRSALLDMLPLDDISQTSNRIWISSWDAALADEGHAAEHAERYRASRAKVAGLVAEFLPESERDDERVDRVTETLHSFVLGLTVQAVLDPSAYPPERQVTLLDGILSDLG
ncbi:TetR/AcrR family transcriptional regulator [Microbacterium binotii]|uniref:TetR/AcrR family transcriptional regulator n=1 Tax=Microbacterium binotii TaxID=462710 RepID=UPI001F3D9746|nr:TetR family transcriptional regulator C-terminal domain-containing protein [Microbacterium binotii]UIN30586.1 TetR family transcriptional regulator C-terminal domain-containing protein [Microbacterium binotii]